VHGDKVPPCSLWNWSRTVKRFTHSCTEIRAESNKLFLVIIKCVLSIYLESFKGTVLPCSARRAAAAAAGGGTATSAGH